LRARHKPADIGPGSLGAVCSDLLRRPVHLSAARRRKMAAREFPRLLASEMEAPEGCRPMDASERIVALEHTVRVRGVRRRWAPARGHIQQCGVVAHARRARPQGRINAQNKVRSVIQGSPWDLEIPQYRTLRTTGCSSTRARVVHTTCCHCPPSPMNRSPECDGCLHRKV
jgi:hypothetical protein